MAKAYGAMIDALGGSAAFLQLRMIESGLYEKLAQANASAVQGMAPKITSWNTTSGGGGSSGQANDGMAAIRNIMQTLPPLISTIHEQTGMAPPSWMVQMPGSDEKTLLPGSEEKALLPGTNGA